MMMKLPKIFMKKWSAVAKAKLWVNLKLQYPALILALFVDALI